MKTKKKIHHNVKVAQNRGDTWRKNLMKGKVESAQNPSRLRLTRLNAGISQERLAQDVGMATNTLGAVERGVRPVTKIRAEKIAESLGKRLNYFFKRHDNDPVKFVAKK
jgi:DNA-binding XRE family transcriptional regulator